MNTSHAIAGTKSKSEQDAEHQVQTRNLFKHLLNNNNNNHLVFMHKHKHTLIIHPLSILMPSSWSSSSSSSQYLSSTFFIILILILMIHLKHSIKPLDLILINNNQFTNSNKHSNRLLQPQMLC